MEKANWTHCLLTQECNAMALDDRCSRTAPKFARAQGSGALHVVGNPHAEDFYIACGFKVIGTTETRFGTGLLMRMMIKP